MEVACGVREEEEKEASSGAGAGAAASVATANVCGENGGGDAAAAAAATKRETDDADNTGWLEEAGDDGEAGVARIDRRCCGLPGGDAWGRCNSVNCVLLPAALSNDDLGCERGDVTSSMDGGGGLSC